MRPARQLPGGLVTFVITDIEGSTRLLRQLGNAYVAALERHRELLRAVWAEFDGAEVNTEGDSFIVAFGDSAAAVRACAAAMRVIDREPWGGEPFRIRIGAHCGPAQPRDGDYVALALHQTARVAGAANGGQAIVTDEVLAAAELDESIALAPLGRYRLRDFDGPVNLHRVDPPGREPATTPLRALPAERHNFPRPPTPIVDRDAELARLVELVESGSVTTVCGPGGVGKTRLVTEFGRRVADEWPDGVWMCPLAPLGSASELPVAVARTLAIPLKGAADPTRLLFEALDERTCVVVLDNCEPMSADVAAFVAGLRAAAPSVAVLATSRAPLGTSAERRLRLDPFTTDDTEGDTAGPAVQLFLLRAADAGGRETDDTDAIRRLCERLDGLPLAIELAAARTDVLPPRELLASFDRRLGAIRTDDPLAPARHRSMDATIDWSYDLLDAAERAVLRRLTVLRASFDLDLATAVCADDGLDPDLVPELVWSLVSKSVVDRHRSEGETRYRLFSTVRARVGERSPADELAGAADRAAHHLDAIVGPDRLNDRQWTSRADVELDNLHGVLDHASGVDPRVALRLLWTIGMLHDVKDEFSLGIEELERRVADAPPAPELVGVLTLLADLRLRVGDIEGAEETLRRAEDLSRRTGPAEWDLGGVARTKGELALRGNDLETAERIAREALAAGAAGQAAARLWNLLGLAQASRNDLTGAVAAFEHELAIWDELGRATAATVVHGNLAEALLRIGDRSAAAGHQLECLRGGLDLGRPLLVAFSLTVAAHLAAEASEWELALELQGASDVLLDEADYALYDADEVSRSELVRRAADHVAAPEVSTLLARGRTLATVDAVARASRVLEVAAGTR